MRCMLDARCPECENVAKVNDDLTKVTCPHCKFEKTYEEHFGRAIEGLQIEVVGWSVKVTSPRPETEKTITVDSENIVTTDSKRVVYDPAKGTEVEASVFQRENLSPGDCVMGPAIIVESQTTTWVSSEKKSSTQHDDCLLITKKTEAVE